MDSSIIVMIVTLALPNGDHSVNVKPMPTATACQQQAKIEASDPYVAGVECSELSDGKLELRFEKAQKRKIPETAFDRSTG